ncbi:MAG: DUF1553 domain-containing protein, partial [Verrucomicrobia bacterium]|nr:DUF1553 domain-containing protein [Verrucomicrobiota bacterium]
RAFFEPLQVRQDRVQGEPDPGTFQPYEYSVIRKVITNGLVSVFDEKPQAPTYLYLRGDERSIPENKPSVPPGLPAFLSGAALDIKPVTMPLLFSRPGLKEFAKREDEQKAIAAQRTAAEACAGSERQLSDAQTHLSSLAGEAPLAVHTKALADSARAQFAWLASSNALAVADAELASVRARILADEAWQMWQQGNSEQAHADEKSQTAAKAQKALTLRKAQARQGERETAVLLLEMQQAIAGADPNRKPDDKAAAQIKKAREEAESAAKSTLAAAAELESAVPGKHTPLGPTYPVTSSGRRLALARWIGSTTNPLTARVAINHIWTRHFHSPLVNSMFDFGRNGSSPEHPELLDWLAVELMEHGWQMKPIHYQIVTSRAYRRSSKPDGIGRTADPENKTYWRMNAGQLESEAVRDSILHVAGELDFGHSGPPLPNSQAEDSRVRSIYFECFPEPGGASEFAEMFDAPSPMECYRRTETIVPQQALAMANSRLSSERSRALAARLATRFQAEGEEGPDAFIRAAFETVLSRQPRPAEHEAAREFLRDTKESGHQSLLHALFNHHDFVTIR